MNLDENGMKLRFWATLVGVFATTLPACSPGYMKASELESKHQGPADCEARCVELGMRMGALVLVSDTLPGCVCQPKPPAEAPKPNPGQPAPGQPAPDVPAPSADVSREGASAATASYAVLAAAAVARASQYQLQRQAEQNNLPR